MLNNEKRAEKFIPKADPPAMWRRGKGNFTNIIKTIFHEI